MQGRGLLTIGLGLLAAVLLLVVFQSFQLHTLEERMLRQSSEIQALGESSDRMVARLDRIAKGGVRLAGGAAGAAGDEYADVETLHPDWENRLEAPLFSIANPDAPQDGHYVRGWAWGDPKGFNPLIENAAEFSYYIENVANSNLITRQRFVDPDKWQAGLAWRVEESPDKKEIIAYLRKGVMWHKPANIDLSDPRYAWLNKPHEFTAHDVVFNFKMIQHPQVENGFIKGYYKDLERVEAIDDYTVRFVWKKSLYNNFSFSLYSSVIPEFLYAYDESGQRFPEETLGLRFNQHWYNNKGYVGVGPYRMTNYEPGVKMEFERNEDYWGDKPPIKKLTYLIYTDPNRTLLMLKSKEILFGSLRPSEYTQEWLRWQDMPAAKRPKDNPFANGSIKCEPLSAFAFYYIGWNMNRPLFNDARVRKAMTYAFNREGIIRDIFKGLGEVAVGPFLPQGPYNDPAIQPLPFDLDAARAELTRAGWRDTDGDGLVDNDLDGDGDREPFSFTLLISANVPEYTAAATVLKDDLLKIGIRMGIEAVEWSLRQKRSDERDFDAMIAGWGNPWESDPYQIWHSSQADTPKGSNFVGFRNEEVDRLIIELRSTFDLQERIAKYRRIHQILDGEQPYSFFRAPQVPVCWWKDLKGVRFAKSKPQFDAGPWWIEQE